MFDVKMEIFSLQKFLSVPQTLRQVSAYYVLNIVYVVQ